MEYNYLGSARNVRELKELLEGVDTSATLTLKAPSDEPWSFIEVWLSEAGDDIMIK